MRSLKSRLANQCPQDVDHSARRPTDIPFSTIRTIAFMIIADTEIYNTVSFCTAVHVPPR
jgi:hypothetical protein